jgi:hypothetical protein
MPTLAALLLNKAVGSMIPKSILALVLFLILAAAHTRTAEGQASRGALPAQTIETRLPNFSLPTAQGGAFDSSSLHGHSVLLSFLQVLPDNQASDSREQLQYLLSMQAQYGSRNLTVVLGDASQLRTGIPTEADQLLNATYDLHLGKTVLLRDTDRHLARILEVDSVPTTILFDGNGQQVDRWNHIVLPAFLAEAITVHCPASRAPK